MGKLKKLIYSATILSALLLAACKEDTPEENVGNPVEEGGTEVTPDNVENEETSDDEEDVEDEETSTLVGPDDDKPVDLSMVETVSVPQGYKATFKFTVESDIEQAIFIYDENNVLVAEKGSHSGRDLSVWETPINSTSAPVTYKVTGWYKNTKTGDESLPLIQSPQKRTQLDDDSISIGFNDIGSDQDFNDIEAIFTLVPSMYGTDFGPDDNNSVDLSKVDFISVPQGSKATFNFTVESDLELAIFIYDENNVLVAEKGTHSGRDLSVWETPINNTSAPVTYKVTGWYKNTKTGNKDLPWIQSPQKRSQLDDGSISIGFNDSESVNDQDFNDIEAIFTIVP